MSRKPPESKRKEVTKMSGSLMAVFDFDGVLFDDKKFKKDYESLFARAGISGEFYKKTYDQAKKKGYYDPRVHVKVAAHGLSGGSVMEKHLYARLLEFTRKTGNYIFPDVKEFLTYLGEQSIRTILLSTGDPVFQNQKITKSGVSNLFDQIIIIPDVSKVSALRAWIKKEQPLSTVFIDDKKQVLEEVKRSLPGVYVVQMRRESTTHGAWHIDGAVHDFAGLKEFIDEWKREHSG
ncbi:MAG: HAD hydrolase-like protein [bacterium]|nr:HAD hydrolase-like protein [bacterium]MDZ4285570.1 HAD hydrolase-like protein [Candidatus Sungbacteria bacterium]